MSHPPGKNGRHSHNGHASRLLAIRNSTSYRQSHVDPDFMGRVELRPVRLQLELLKPELIMQEQGVMVQSYWRSLYRHVDPKVKGADMHATFEHHHYKWWIDA